MLIGKDKTDPLKNFNHQVSLESPEVQVPSNLEFFPEEKEIKTTRFPLLETEENTQDEYTAPVNVNHPNFYSKEIHHFFTSYLKGKLTMEEFISIKNSPSRYYKRYLSEINT